MSSSPLLSLSLLLQQRSHVLPRRAPPATDCLAQPCRDARGHWRRATGTWPIVCGMWHTAGPAPAPAGSHSTHTGSQLCRPLTSGTTKSHLLAWRMPMVASCSTEQLPLSSYSMFNIWCGKENEFFLPIWQSAQGCTSAQNLLPREVRIHMSQVSASWRGSSAEMDTVELGHKKSISCPLPPVAEVGASIRNSSAPGHSPHQRNPFVSLDTSHKLFQDYLTSLKLQSYSNPYALFPSCSLQKYLAPV